MKINLKNVHVLIIGGSSGMGFEMAKELLKHQATVTIASSNSEKLNNAYQHLNKQFDSIYKIQMDVSNEESVKQAATWYKTKFKQLDLLIEDAGIGDNKIQRDDPFFTIQTNVFKKIVEINFIGYFIVAKYFIPLMKYYGKGKLVYVTTSTSTLSMPGQIPYGPSKAASETMSTILSKELANSNITVNTICPGGFTDTPMASNGSKEFFIKNNLPILPPTIMNKIALFMASNLSNNLNNEKLVGKDFDQWLKTHQLELE